MRSSGWSPWVLSAVGMLPRGWPTTKHLDEFGPFGGIAGVLIYFFQSISSLCKQVAIIKEILYH